MNGQTNVDKKGHLSDNGNVIFRKGNAKNLIDGGERPGGCGSRYCA
jgi:hypothetical protein